ncbi:MAG: nucleotidyltransferase domain-containing protein [Deltaproteobacteria bacterium]|nr:nucleotidyltransferase domain-containing protein [Deltaproteobacteria bacterium]MBI4223806.1 nucleotidyltransferase domain-containing protein [Deltaproteobacteria bacterium]
MKFSEIFKKHPQIELAFQYGSSVKKDQKKARDIDIAILLKKGFSAEERLDIQLAVADAAGRHFKKEVDVAVLNTSSPFLAYQVIKHGRLLYDPRNKSHDFVVQTLTRYFDYLPLHRFFVDKLYKDLGVEQKNG